MKTFNKTVSWFLGVLSFMVPVFLLVFPGNVYPATRLSILFFMTVFAFALWCVKNFLHKGAIIIKGNFYLPFLLLLAFAVISVLILPNSSAMNDAIFGTAGILILMMILSLILIHLVERRNVNVISWGLCLAGVSTSIVVIFSYFSIVNKFIPPSFFSGINFITGESAYYLLAFFGVFLVLGISFLPKKENMIPGLTLILSSLVGLTVLIINQFKSPNPAVFLPVSSGWAMTIELFKNFKNLFLGIGFNQFGLYSPLLKTAELNTDKYVFMRFPQTSNGILEIINSLGILGFLLFVFLFIKIYRAFSSHGFGLEKSPSGIFYVFPFAAVILAFFFLPLNPVLLFLLFLFFALFIFGLKEAKTDGFEETKLQLLREGEGFLSLQTGEINAKYQYAPKIFAIFGGFLSLMIFYFVIVYPAIAERHFAVYLHALLANNGRTAYEEMNAAVGADPAKDIYMTELSRVNFQLALSLNAQKKLTDQDRQNITILVKQAIRMAQKAVDVNPNKLTNWENLASIYQSLITTDPASIELSAQAYLKAVSLSPQDPGLRVSFAQMLYAAKSYQDAINQLNAALTLKSDYANAYYNLGLNYKALGQTDNAKRAFEFAQKLVTKNSNDEKVIKNALSRVDEVAAAPTPAAPASAEATVGKTASESGKLTNPKEEPKLENLKTDELKLKPASGSGTTSQ